MLSSDERVYITTKNNRVLSVPLAGDGLTGAALDAAGVTATAAAAAEERCDFVSIKLFLFHP